MNFILETKDKKIPLRFSNYFLDRVGKLAGKTLSETPGYIVGDVVGDEGVRGGMLDDLEVRATVIAAGIDANNLANGELTKASVLDGFVILETVPDCLTNPVWGEMFLEITKSLIPDKLDSEKTKKKAAAKKKSR